MNKNVLLGIGGIVIAGLGYGIYKAFSKKEDKVEDVENIVEEVKENVKETSTKDDDFLNKMMEEEKEAEEATKNWTEREERCKKEMSEKESVNNMNMFTDDVSESKEFEALNKIREASGKEPLKVDEKFEKFLGKDSKSKSLKESLDNIAENVKKDPELKKRVLDILSE